MADADETIRSEAAAWYFRRDAGPLAPEAAPDSEAARTIAQSIAGLSARMLFRHATPELTLVSKVSA